MRKNPRELAMKGKKFDQCMFCKQKGKHVIFRKRKSGEPHTDENSRTYHLNKYHREDIMRMNPKDYPVTARTCRKYMAYSS
jgi:hypothetical protein